MRADAGELDDGSTTADNCIVANGAMPRQHDVVREHDVIANMAVVTDVRIGKKRTTVSNDGLHAPTVRSRIDRDALADDTLSANRQCRRFAAVLEVLRLVTDRSKRIDLGFGTDRRSSRDGNMRNEFTTIAKDDIGIDDALGPNATRIAHLGPVSNDSRRVNASISHEDVPSLRYRRSLH